MYIKKGEERSKAFPKSIKVFLLYTVFGLMVPEICQLENITHYAQAWQMIRAVEDQLKANEILLLGESHQERGDAKKTVKKSLVIIEIRLKTSYYNYKFFRFQFFIYIAEAETPELKRQTKIYRILNKRQDHF